MHVIVVGAGIFGVTGALALAERGHAVSLLDPGPLPHPLAASTDLSKVVRLEYGSDEPYTSWMERALLGFRRWNQELGFELYHETGVLFLARGALAAGGFEHDSRACLVRRGHAIETLDRAAISMRFPAWNAAAYGSGTFDPQGGWVESGRLVERLLARAARLGVTLHEGFRVHVLLDRGGRVCGVVSGAGEELEAEHVVLAGGSWTHHLLPELAPVLRSVGQPVFHLKPDEPALFEASRFPVFGADISSTGYYGFPLHPSGVVKIANHGRGREMHPEASARAVTAEETAELRDFLAETFPRLASAPIVATRVCLYSDTWDGHFWIARSPDRAGLTVAAGGSGHAFKFAPLLGDWIADAALGVKTPDCDRFRWRPEVRPERTSEEARAMHTGSFTR